MQVKLRYIHLFNLANTFNDLFHHIYMSPESHVKFRLKMNDNARQQNIFQLRYGIYLEDQ